MPARTVARETADGALFGSRPIRPVTGVQRASVVGARSVASSTPAGSAAPVRVMRDAAVASTAAQLKAKAFTHAGDVYLPAHHGPLDSGSGRSLLAHELTHVQQQRDLGASLPAEHTPEGQRLERAAQVAESSGSLPLNLRLAAPAAARSSRASAVAQRTSSNPASAAVEDDSEGDEPATVYTAGTTGLSPSPVHSMQRAEEVSATAAAPPAATAGMPKDAQELEELAAKLRDRLRHRMRRELLHDRERAGMVADLS
jgi:hypothetical protein